MENTLAMSFVMFVIGMFCIILGSFISTMHLSRSYRVYSVVLCVTRYIGVLLLCAAYVLFSNGLLLYTAISTVIAVLLLKLPTTNIWYRMIVKHFAKTKFIR